MDIEVRPVSPASAPAVPRRIVSGLALVLGPLFLLISTVLETRGLDVHRLLDEIAQRPGANQLSFGLAFCGFALFVPATMGLLRKLRPHAAALAYSGGALLILGMISFVFVIGTESVLYIAGGDPSVGRDAIIAVNDAIGKSVVYNIINLTEIAGYGVGTVVLAVALYRAKAAPRIIPLLLVTGVLTRFAFAGFFIGTVLGDVLYFIAFAYLGIAVWRQSDSTEPVSEVARIGQE